MPTPLWGGGTCQDRPEVANVRDDSGRVRTNFGHLGLDRPMQARIKPKSGPCLTNCGQFGPCRLNFGQFRLTFGKIGRRCPKCGQTGAKSGMGPTFDYVDSTHAQSKITLIQPMFGDIIKLRYTISAWSRQISKCFRPILGCVRPSFNCPRPT